MREERVSGRTATRRRAGPRLTLVIALVAAAVAWLPASPAAAAPGLSVSPASGLTPGQTVSVNGSGYSTTANDGVGIYVAWCKLVARYWANAENCGDAEWINGARLGAGGSFSVSLTLTGLIGSTDCTVPASCAVVTMAAHGRDDRSQDAVAKVSFQTVVVITAPPTPPAATTAPLPPPATTSAATAATTAATTAPTSSAAPTTAAASPTPTPSDSGVASSSTRTSVEATTSVRPVPSDSTISGALASDDVDRSGGSPLWPWLLLGLAVLVAGGGAGFLFYRLRLGGPPGQEPPA